MGSRAASESGAAAIRSPICWALLGLVIQRASYGYEFVQRFERTYDDALELSSPSQVYTALDTLARHALVEELREPPPATAPPAGVVRQPKPHYRATAEGVRRYREWLVGQLDDERRRSRLFVHQLAMLAPKDALAVIERFEHACLTRVGVAPPPGAADAAGEDAGGLVHELLCEEHRLATQARLAWIEYARRRLAAPRSGRTPAR